MAHIVSFCLGFFLDLLFGDPLGGFHLVVWIGKLIAALERFFRRLLPQTPRGQLWGGIGTVFLVCALSFGISSTLIWAGYRLHWIVGLMVESFFCWQCLAARSLTQASLHVYEASDLEQARRAVGGIVGRDTSCLDQAACIRACVETVAENCSDGVIAPMLFLALGGGAWGVFYKAVNTMDSMLGYKNDRYLYFGRAAARLDDIVNFIPARLAGLGMVLSSFLTGQDGRNAWRIFRRDRRNHTSPNSAQTESACAGALHIRLGGPNQYFGRLVKKPYIGDDDRPIVPDDIPAANRLMLGCSWIFFLLCVMGMGVALWL